MRKILAISGGIDSVSLLHMMKDDPEVLVAHFNHGIRLNSGQDETFVHQLANKYGREFISKTENLGANCPEALARERRYRFLRNLQTTYSGVIYTAHHQDDLVESIIINLIRGTGWRGLAPFSNPEIRRPLLELTKAKIYAYASKHQLAFRHDATNTDDRYLRNRIRRQATKLAPKDRQKLLELFARQNVLRSEIATTLDHILPPGNTYERNWFMQLDNPAALEILRQALVRVGRSTTRPQLLDFLAAIRTYQTGKHFNLGQDYLVPIGRHSFTLEP